MPITLQSTDEIASAPPKQERSSTDVFREILRGLYEGRYVPGQRLIEKDLAEEYQVSRFIVREAISKLASEGAANVSFNRGARIPRLSRSDVSNVLELMEWIFSMAARRAAGNITKGENLALWEQNAQALFALEGSSDFFEFGRVCGRFYRTMAKLSGNGELRRVLPAMQVHLVRVQFMNFPSAAENHRYAQYRDIYQAIQSGDEDRAESSIRHHFRTFAADILSLPDRAFAPEQSDD